MSKRKLLCIRPEKFCDIDGDYAIICLIHTLFHVFKNKIPEPVADALALISENAAYGFVLQTKPPKTSNECMDIKYKLLTYATDDLEVPDGCDQKNVRAVLIKLFTKIDRWMYDAAFGSSFQKNEKDQEEENVSLVEQEVQSQPPKKRGKRSSNNVSIQKEKEKDSQNEEEEEDSLVEQEVQSQPSKKRGRESSNSMSLQEFVQRDAPKKEKEKDSQNEEDDDDDDDLILIDPRKKKSTHNSFHDAVEAFRQMSTNNNLQNDLEEFRQKEKEEYSTKNQNKKKEKEKEKEKIFKCTNWPLLLELLHEGADVDAFKGLVSQTTFSHWKTGKNSVSVAAEEKCEQAVYKALLDQYSGSVDDLYEEACGFEDLFEHVSLE